MHETVSCWVKFEPTRESRVPSSPQNRPPSRTPSPTHLPPRILVVAHVIPFHYEMELYWFRIDATFQPYNTTNSNSVPSLKQHILFRNYDDFYDFQVNLFNTFPREAGTVHAGASSATGRRGHSISTGGSGHKLCELNHPRAKYILEHDVVREFLALKPGDVETEVDA